MLISKAVFWFVVAFVFAAIEIESEGKYGWAQMFPTWYRTTGLAGRIYGKLMGGRPLTGYHLWMFFLPILVFHAAFFMGAPWSTPREIMAFALYFAWCPLWDFLWFVLNPAYGTANFRRAKIWWHAKSPWLFGRIPVGYAVLVILSLGLAALAAEMAQDVFILLDHAALLMTWGLLLGAADVIGPHYGRWRLKMLERDDRDKAGIFHDDDAF